MQRGATNGWAGTCGPVDNSTRAASSSTLAAELLADHGDPEAAAVFAGLGSAELMSGRYATAEHWCTRVFDVVPAADDNPEAWVMATRVLGIVRSNQGDPDQAVELCRESVAAAVGARARAFANVYLCVALIDAGHYQAATNTALDAIAESQLTGLNGFDCYFDSLAAEALTRLGRWSEAATVLARQPVAARSPLVCSGWPRARAMLAARCGDADRALGHLADAQALPVDGWHQSVLDATAADVHLVLGNWDEAAAAAERGRDSAATSALWAARFAMFGVTARVERTLDRRARREHIDLDATSAPTVRSATNSSCRSRQRAFTCRTSCESSASTAESMPPPSRNGSESPDVDSSDCPRS